MQAPKTAKTSTQSHSTVFFSLSFAVAALVAALAGAGSNASQSPFAVQTASASAHVVPFTGQANGSLTSNLLNPHDLRRRLRERILTGVNIVETSHHQSRFSL